MTEWLFNRDCLEIMEDLIKKGVKVDAIITDPPYGISYKPANLLNDDNLDWVKQFTYLCGQVLKKDRHLYCFVDPEYSPEFILGFRENGFKIRNLLTLPRGVKGSGGERIYQQQFEFCLFATLGRGRKFNQTKILKTSEGYLRDKRNKHKSEYIYRLPDNWHWLKGSVHNLQNPQHPTQKTVEAMEVMLQMSSNEGEIVLDPFMGSGTTGVACKKLNRNFIGGDLDKRWVEVAKERIKNAKI